MHPTAVLEFLIAISGFAVLRPCHWISLDSVAKWPYGLHASYKPQVDLLVLDEAWIVTLCRCSAFLRSRLLVRTWILQVLAHPVITPFLPSQVPPCLAAVLRTSATLLPWSITSSQPLLSGRILSCFRGPPSGEDTIRPAAIFSALPMVPSNLCAGCGLCM